MAMGGSGGMDGAQLAALVNGVKGGKWFSLMDKIYAGRTLRIAWQRVKSNKGAVGIDRISIERFDGQAEQVFTRTATAT